MMLTQGEAVYRLGEPARDFYIVIDGHLVQRTGAPSVDVTVNAECATAHPALNPMSNHRPRRLSLLVCPLPLRLTRAVWPCQGPGSDFLGSDVHLWRAGAVVGLAAGAQRAVQLRQSGAGQGAAAPSRLLAPMPLRVRDGMTLRPAFVTFAHCSFHRRIFRRSWRGTWPQPSRTKSVRCSSWPSFVLWTATCSPGSSFASKRRSTSRGK